MKQYKIQYAYPKEIGTPSIHNNEAAAAGEVAYLLGTWLYRSLSHALEHRGALPRPITEALSHVLPEVKRLIGEGRVWEAYELWEDFYIQFENWGDMPLYAVIGTVIVEGSPETGLKNRIPLLEVSDISPIKQHAKRPVIVVNRLDELMDRVVMEVMEVAFRKAALKGIEITPEEFHKAVQGSARALPEHQMVDEESEREVLVKFREGILRRLFPKSSEMGLGALTTWLVQYADIGGTWHPGRHTSEGRAKEQARDYLMVLIEHLAHHASVESLVNRNPKYVKEAKVTVKHVKSLLDQEMIWAAYLDYKAFEEIWNDYFEPFSLQMSIGTMRVIPTPESEMYAS